MNILFMAIPSVLKKTNYMQMKRAWFIKHKIGCINCSHEFHTVDSERKNDNF